MVVGSWSTMDATGSSYIMWHYLSNCLCFIPLIHRQMINIEEIKETGIRQSLQEKRDQLFWKIKKGTDRGTGKFSLTSLNNILDEMDVTIVDIRHLIEEETKFYQSLN